MALRAVFEILSFSGLDAVSTHGNGARVPRKDIPRAILGVAIVGGL